MKLRHPMKGFWLDGLKRHGQATGVEFGAEVEVARRPVEMTAE